MYADLTRTDVLRLLVLVTKKMGLLDSRPSALTSEQRRKAQNVWQKIGDELYKNLPPR